MRWTALALLVGILGLTSHVCADWQAPADGILSEDQLKNYLAAAAEWRDQMKQLLQQEKSAQDDAAKLAVVRDIDQKELECLSRHHLGKAEFKWAGAQAMEAWAAVAYLDDVDHRFETEIPLETKSIDAKSKDARARLLAFQEAQKNGRRLMSPEDRDAAIKNAQSDQQAALDEAKQHAEDVKTAQADAQRHDADAKAADDLAKNPPPEVAAADRQDYIDGKKKEADAARDVAKDARDREAGAKKDQDDAELRAASDAQRAKDPEVPLSGEEKAHAKADNDEGIEIAQKEIADLGKESAQISQSEIVMKQQADAAKQKIPAENMALMRKYKDQYVQAIGGTVSGAATQPAN